MTGPRFRGDDNNMKNFLNDIIEHKKKINAEKKEFYHTLRDKLGGATYSRYALFKKQISKPGQINLIAEIKKASPSKGLIRDDFDVAAIAGIYTDEKAAAISVLTEDKYFLGKPMYVKQVADNFHVPVLTKDFIIDEGQIYEARLTGSSAVLLIAAILTDKEIRDFYRLATDLDLDCLVEIHDQEELKRVLDCGVEIIGINNRDLKSFEVDLKISEMIIPRIPKDKVIVSESGISTFNEVKHLKDLGAHAVLIGETFMREKDIRAKLREVMGYAN